MKEEKQKEKERHRRNKEILARLKQMQSMPMKWKVFHSIEVMQTFISRIGGIDHAYISFSGGVDSLVLLDMARRYISKDFKAAFCNTGMEWQEIVKFVKTFDNVDIIHPKYHAKEIFETEGFPLISKENSFYIREIRHLDPNCSTWKIRMGNGKFSLPKKWRKMIDKPYEISEKCCKYLKKEPMAEYEKKTGRHPILGIMAAESRLRTATYIRDGGCNSFDKGRIKSHPLSVWYSDDIWEYIRHTGIEYCHIYDMLSDKRTGCICCGYGVTKDPHKLDTLYKLYPKVYKNILSWKNNGCPFRTALRDSGIILPDENPIFNFK